MIAGFFHEGSGLGDQLFRYITVRTLAEDKGYEWGMICLDNFKGDFLNIKDHHDKDFLTIGVTPPEEVKRWNEKDIRDEFGNDVRSYDPEINFVQDNTVIDGSFEDDKYWRHRLPEISKWLAVEPLSVPDDLCVIGFRGGEYALNPNLFLTPEYFEEAIFRMRKAGLLKFEVHTDDPIKAGEFFMDMPIVENAAVSHSKHMNMGLNWRSARYAKYAIIPNSAFFILPRLLKHLEDPDAVTIAPRYWARRNTNVWARPACFYKEFTYL